MCHYAINPVTLHKLNYFEEQYVIIYILYRPPWINRNKSQHMTMYHQTSDIKHTKSQNLNVSRLVLQLSLPNQFKPGVKLGMKMYCKTSNIRRTLVGNKIVHHSDVVGASPVGAAPTTSSFST